MLSFYKPAKSARASPLGEAAVCFHAQWLADAHQNFGSIRSTPKAPAQIIPWIQAEAEKPVHNGFLDILKATKMNPLPAIRWPWTPSASRRRRSPSPRRGRCSRWEWQWSVPRRPREEPKDTSLRYDGDPTLESTADDPTTTLRSKEAVCHLPHERGHRQDAAGGDAGRAASGGSLGWRVGIGRRSSKHRQVEAPQARLSGPPVRFERRRSRLESMRQRGQYGARRRPDANTSFGLAV